eukprot:TRINITY_DN30123_c0_g1_i1.p2 TRINITY_DN30123_c0_g1~~TRINITY_DN30123_c0_g1_i1.p2  ORF type:complete len:133 (+),score=39.81 TRINITY_DN30123_c0_g1_i1:36-434(+)
MVSRCGAGCLCFGRGIVFYGGGCCCFFFSSRRRHTRCREVSWARRCVQETGINAEYMGTPYQAEPQFEYSQQFAPQNFNLARMPEEYRPPQSLPQPPLQYYGGESMYSQGREEYGADAYGYPHPQGLSLIHI